SVQSVNILVASDNAALCSCNIGFLLYIEHRAPKVRHLKTTKDCRETREEPFK
ncbi:uncharacterized, partial [Tachysurus ichikawai]